MAAIAVRLESLARGARDRLRVMGSLASGAGLWVLIAALFIWSATSTTQLFVVGVVVGSILTLGALGLTLIYGVLKFGNFAHGDAMMTGAYVAFFALTGRVLAERRDTELLPWSLGDLPGARDAIGHLSFGYGLLLATLVAAVVIAALSLGLDRFVYRPLRRRDSGIVIFAVASIGIAIGLRSLMLIFWGPDPRVYVAGIRPTSDLPFGVRVVNDQIFIFFAALLMSALVYLLLFRTKLGKAMRAMADNPELAKVSGINTEQIVAWTWVTGGGLMAVGGVLLALQAQLNPQLGFVLLLPLFAATILGGIGNPLGALLGAMVVGVAQESSIEFFAPGYKPGVAFVILILILLLRPRGLLGERA